MVDIDAIVPALGAGAISRTVTSGRLLSTDRPRWWFIGTVALSGAWAGTATIDVEVRAGVLGVSLIGADESAPWAEREVGVGHHTIVLDLARPEVRPKNILMRSCDPRDLPVVLIVKSIKVTP